MNSPLNIDAYFDLICPWCLIGKRNLSQAIAQLEQEIPDLVLGLKWHSVQLLSDLPDEGVDFTSFYLDRLGSAGAVRQRQAQVLAAAAAAEAKIDFSRIQRMPNTRKAHQLMAFAAEQLDAENTEALLERLLAAHFNRGENLSNMEVLRGIAAVQGLDLMKLDAWVSTNRGLPKPMALSPLVVDIQPTIGKKFITPLTGSEISTFNGDIAKPIELPGVPFFVFNGSHAISGAQSPDALLAAMRLSLREGYEA